MNITFHESVGESTKPCVALPVSILEHEIRLHLQKMGFCPSFVNARSNGLYLFLYFTCGTEVHRLDIQLS